MDGGETVGMGSGGIRVRGQRGVGGRVVCGRGEWMRASSRRAHMKGLLGLLDTS